MTADQQRPAGAPVAGETLYPRFSSQEFGRRWAAARALMAREGVDVLVVHGESSLNRHAQADVLWLSGFLGNRQTYVVVGTAGAPVLFVHPHNHVPNAREMASVEVRWGGPDAATAVAHHVRTLRAVPGTLGYVGPVPVQAYLTGATSCPSGRWSTSPRPSVSCA